MKRAFTLIELLVVIAILAILSAIVLASLNAARAKANDARMYADFRQIYNAANQDFNDNGVWAADVSPNVAPSFVPTYLSSWPKATYYCSTCMYDWQGSACPRVDLYQTITGPTLHGWCMSTGCGCTNF